MGVPRLSLILCSRNDAYLGNSRWRLETALNYAGSRVAVLGREADVEILVCDWGSDVPLRDAITLTPAAARIVSFLTVPPAVARAVQGDSPFAEVIALNAAARRARGDYVGRIDQDTLTGERFLRWFFDMIESGGAPGVPDPPAKALLYANRRAIPYRLAVRCPPYHVIERFLAWFQNQLWIETGRNFYKIDVGVWMIHRDLWNACGGYSERMIYMNDMEIDMVHRLIAEGHPIVNVGKLIGYDFYHLDHYHPGGSRSSSTHRQVNTFIVHEPAGLRPSGEGWGLAAYALEVAGVRPEGILPLSRHPVREWLVFLAYAGYTGMWLVLDRLLYPFYPRWKRRAGIAWTTVRGHSIRRWPSMLRRLWADRPSARGPVAR